MSAAFGPELPQIRNVITAIPGPRSQALAQRRKAAVSSSLGAAVPIYAERAGGGVIIDVDGNSFIDLAAGIAVTNVGNSAPAVVAGVTDQVHKLTHTCFMVAGYEPYIEVCEQLNELTPGDHEKHSALFNSGAEAVENAVKVARAHTGRPAVVVFEHAYHGRTNLTMGMTAKNMPYKESFGPFAPEVYRVPTSYPLRDGLSGAAAAARSLQRIEFEIGSHNVAAVMIEPIKGEGGFIVPAEGFLPAVSAWCTDNGAVFVADEIQTGFCRTGAWFACEHEGVVPDLITTAKGIAGGLPLAALTGRADMMDAVHVGGLGGTYGGNPVACAAALGAIRTMKELDLSARAQRIGELITQRLTQLQHDVPVIAEVRGRGAMVAIEFAEPDTLKPLTDLPKQVAAACAQQGVVILTAGTYGNVIRLLPPLVICDDLLIEGMDVLSEAITSSGRMTDVAPFWVGSQPVVSAESVTISNPYDASVVGTHAVPTAADVETAVRDAHRVQPAALATTAAQRAAALLHVSNRLLQRADEVAALITAENGKPLLWSRAEAHQRRLDLPLGC